MSADATELFLTGIRQSGLLSPAQDAELAAWAAHARTTPAGLDVQGLAKEIHRRQWLTPYQIKEIFKGRGPGLTLGPYVLLDLLGEGGMGRVYKARHSRLGREEALKVIRAEKLKHPAALARFEQEMRAVAQMKHPNVVGAHDAGQVGTTHFLSMELVDGTDLTKIVRDRGPLPFAEACEYIRQAAYGLQHAADMGLVHRDIKPSNLIVARGGRQVKVLDFGLARLEESPAAQAGGGEDGGRITQEGFVIGTPDFLAPEQARNPTGVDVRADIYSLGATLFYVLTGRVPYDGATPSEKLVKHCTDPPPNLLAYRPDAPPQLAHLIQWCMAKRPEDRPQTPAQLALALQPFCGPPAPAAGPAGFPGAAPPYPAATPAPAGWAAPAPAPVVAPAYAAPYPAPGYQPAAAPYQPAPPGYAPPGYPQPAGYPPGYPAPGVYPAPPSDPAGLQLPPQPLAADPIRGRATAPRSVLMPVLLVFGGMAVAAAIGFAALRQFQGKPDAAVLKDFENSVKMKMVQLPAGSFRMGAEAEPGRDGARGGADDEGPAHEVTLRRPFYVATAEVTQAQFIRVLGRNPSASAKKARTPAELPVESVTWADAVEFCKKLTDDESDQPYARRGWAYRLPTEAEWEYACRAGTTTPFAFGDRLVQYRQAVFTAGKDDDLGEATAEKNPIFPRRVGPLETGDGKREANGFKLYDMHGNVAEWCLDYYQRGYPNDAPRTDPTGPGETDRRVVRGGSWRDPAAACRSSARRGAIPTRGDDAIGFRVVYAPQKPGP